MSEQLLNPFSKVCPIGNDTGTINLELSIGYGQLFTNPISVAFHGALLSPIAGSPTTFSLGPASSLCNQMLSIHVGVQVINPGPPCKASVEYLLKSSSGAILLDGVTDIAGTLNTVVPFGGIIFFNEN